MEKKTIDEIIHLLLNLNSYSKENAIADLNQLKNEYGEQCRKEGFIEARDKTLSYLMGKYGEISTPQMMDAKTAKELQP